MRRDRAVSMSLNYTMTLAIATILVTGLLIASTNFVENQREDVIRDELAVIGQQVASDLARADRLVTAADSNGSNLTVSVNQTFPERVAGSTYHMSIDSSDNLVLTAAGLDVRVTVGLVVQTELETNSSAYGGPVRIVYVSTGADSGTLEVQNG